MTIIQAFSGIIFYKTGYIIKKYALPLLLLLHKQIGQELNFLPDNYH